MLSFLYMTMTTVDRQRTDRRWQPTRIWPRIWASKKQLIGDHNKTQTLECGN